MKTIRYLVAGLALAWAASATAATSYPATIALFKNAGASSSFFNSAYGYAVFPTVGKGGIVVGGAHGKGRVYEQGKYIGRTSMTQLSVGVQFGGEAYSQIIFFEDKRALDEFTKGNFEFSAGVSAVVITAAANATARTTGSSAGASGGKKDATTVGDSYFKGLKVFTIVKGGAMADVSVAGQKFSYTPRETE